MDNGQRLDFGSNREFPFGEVVEGTLIVCLSSDHRKNVAEAFRKPGRYVIPGAQCRGNKYTTIILFTPQVHNESEISLSRFKNWIDNEVLPTLHPSGGKAYYV